MIQDTLLGAVYLSIIDMVLLIAFLYVLGLLFRLFPVINKISFTAKRGKKHGIN